MNTKIYQSSTLDDKAVQEIATLILENGLCVIPTETVYGLAGNGLSEVSVDKIFKAKGRPSDNPLILHIAHPDDLLPITDSVDLDAYRLIEHFWPGPLTLVFKKSKRVPTLVSAGLDTVAIRMPDSPVMLEIIKKAGVPLAAPSANASGRPSATRFHHVFDDLNGKVEAMIDGGESSIGIESTVLDVSSKPFTMLRPGMITKAMIESVLGQKVLASNPLHPLDPPQSPGMKYRHYQPQGNLHVIFGPPEKIALYLKDKFKPTSAIICVNESAPYFQALKVRSIGSLDDLNSVAKELYAALRDMDAWQMEDIYLVADPMMGEALLDRIKKATNETIIELS